METCDICQKEFKNLKAHIRLAHPNVKRDDVSAEDIVKARECLDNAPSMEEMDIAKILYTDIVKPLCEEYGISIDQWENIDQNDYLRVARKIKG